MNRIQSFLAITLTASVFAHAVEKEPAAAPAEKSKPAEEAAPKKEGGDYEARKKEARAALQEARGKGKEAFFAELEKQGTGFLKDFPDKEDGYQILFQVASNSDAEKAREVISKYLSGEKVPEEVRERAKGLLAKFDMVGKPIELKFKAVDDREVDLASMKGKVVLVDFWATWCGPCVAEIPHVKETYAKLHDKGFEIVGISFDDDKDKLTNFVKEKELPWAQYFDGQGWKNAYGQKWGINSIPTMWLVNKKGELVDMNARADLAEKVEKLLAE